MNFDIEELNKEVTFRGMELDYRSMGPNSALWIWTDKKSEEEVARLWLIFHDDHWKFEILTVQEANNGFLKKLAYSLGNFAQNNGINTFTIASPFDESHDAFVHIGFEDTGDGISMAADTRRIADYGNWRKQKGKQPDWHKELE